MKIICIWLLICSTILAEPLVVHDEKLGKQFAAAIGALADEGGHPSAKELSESLANSPESIEIQESAFGEAGDDPSKSVYMIGALYKCGKCDKWHNRGSATAWALTTSGLLVTNYHVMASTKGDVVGVMDQSGNAYAVTEVLAASKESDYAIIRVDGTGLIPLAVAEPAKVGTAVRVISHPRGRYYTHTFGHISRYYYRTIEKDGKEVPFMTITADFAKGSSGGPVLDLSNRVVGMVSSTSSLYTKPSKNKDPQGVLQMVIKNCVPGIAIRKGAGLSE